MTFNKTYKLAKFLTDEANRQYNYLTRSDASRVQHCGIPAHFERMPHRIISCVGLFPPKCG